jgi:hypothetical protein
MSKHQRLQGTAALQIPHLGVSFVRRSPVSRRHADTPLRRYEFPQIRNPQSKILTSDS